MKKYVFVLVILVVPYAAFPQPSQTEIDRVEGLLDSAFARAGVSDMRGSADFAERALVESKRVDYAKGMTYSHFFKGQALFELGNYRMALGHLALAERGEWSQSDAFIMFEIHRVRGRAYAAMSLLENSLTEQKLGLSYIPTMKRKEEDKKFLTSLAYENMAVMYNKMGVLDTSFQYLEMNERLLESMEESFVYGNLINLYGHLGNYYTIVKEYTKANAYFERALDLISKYNHHYTHFTYKKWGDMEMDRNRVDEALSLYFLALENLEEISFTNPIPDLYEKIAECYKKMGDDEKAKYYRFEALELQNAKDSESLKATEQILNDIVSKKEVNYARSLSRAKRIALITIVIGISGICFLILRYEQVKKRKAAVLAEAEKQIEENTNLLLVQDQEKQALQQKVNEAFDDIVQLAKDNSPEFFTRFQEVYPEVVTKILKIDPKLRISELTLCAYVFLGFTTKDIALYTHKSLNTVRNRKHNLKKKLNIPADENTELWFKGLQNRD